MEVVTEGAIGHELVDEDHIGVLVTVADEGDVVAVTELREHLDFYLEFGYDLLRGFFCWVQSDSGHSALMASLFFSFSFFLDQHFCIT